MEETTQQCEQGLVGWEVLYDQDDIEMKPTQNDQFILQGRLSNPTAFAASADPNIMYYHQAMREPVSKICPKGNSRSRDKSTLGSHTRTRHAPKYPALGHGVGHA